MDIDPTTDGTAQADRTRFDFADLTARERYKLLIGAVVPRPIAWVTSVDRTGRVNAAPFSFFNVLSADPAILALGVENHQDQRFKDTGHNIRATGEFTVNIVDHAHLEAMNITAFPFPPDIDELREAKLTAMPGHLVSCPFIAEAPVALARLGFVPAGETPEQAADRLTAISGMERRRLLEASRAAEQRARQIREALARKAAEEAADKWSRE